MIISTEQKKHFLKSMILIREFEKKIVSLVAEGRIKGPVHTAIGQEATIVGACSALEKTDYFMGNHRSHGYMLAKGGNLQGMMDEIFGKETGVNHGRGGSMHLADAGVGSIGATGIVGSGIPVACGAALSSKIKKEKKVSMVFFGDGASNEGTAHESMNLASVWNLPVIFLLENNGCAVTVTSDKASNVKDLYLRGNGYGIYANKVDGQDVEAVFLEVHAAVERARIENEPALIEAKTYRFQEHGEGRAYNNLMVRGYRDKKYHEYMIEKRDPIKLYVERLKKENVITDEEVSEITSDIIRQLDETIANAEMAEMPNETDYNKYIFYSEGDKR